jgi:dTDP-4-amino-4,6-dideoxygalactose transaminase
MDNYGNGNAIATKHNLLVVEDAAQSAMKQSKKQNRKSKSSVAYSFCPNLGALGDGGAIITNDSALAK